MWYEGTFSCGHKGRVQITGPHKDRERKAKRAFNNICENCKKERYLQQVQKNQEENQKALDESKEQGYPVLKGSEKQILWASKIRHDFIEKCKEENIEFSDIINNRIQSNYWINNRYVVESDFKKLLKREKLKNLNLPSLVGTEKQVSWANDIRLNFIEQCDSNDVDFNKIVNENTNASFWIDNEYIVNMNFMDLIDLMSD